MNSKHRKDEERRPEQPTSGNFVTSLHRISLVHPEERGRGRGLSSDAKGLTSYRLLYTDDQALAQYAIN